VHLIGFSIFIDINTGRLPKNFSTGFHDEITGFRYERVLTGAVFYLKMFFISNA
jgi:hypothetical protein